MGEAGIERFQELVEMNATLGSFQTNSILGQALPAGNSRRQKRRLFLLEWNKGEKEEKKDE